MTLPDRSRSERGAPASPPRTPPTSSESRTVRLPPPDDDMTVTFGRQQDVRTVGAHYYAAVPLRRLSVALDLCSALLVLGFICLIGSAFLARSAWAYGTALVGCLLVVVTVTGHRIAAAMQSLATASRGRRESINGR